MQDQRDLFHLQQDEQPNLGGRIMGARRARNFGPLKTRRVSTNWRNAFKILQQRHRSGFPHLRLSASVATPEIEGSYYEFVYPHRRSA